MNDCDAIETLVTPYVDGELGNAERGIVANHLRRCAACSERVDAEVDHPPGAEDRGRRVAR